MTEIQRTALDLIRRKAAGEDCTVPAGIDLADLYRTVRPLHLAPYLWDAVSKTPDSKLRSFWEEDWQMAYMKDGMQAEEKERVDAALSGAGIRFLYLKGTVLKSFWKDPCERYMGDADFLFEGDDAKLRAALESVGYTATHFGSRDYSHHFVFEKAPWFVLEPHYQLLDSSDPYAGFLCDAFERAIPDPILPGRCQISPEDLYLHLLIHARKHIVHGGIGLRSFLDFTFLLRAYPDLPKSDFVRSVVSANRLGAFEGRVVRLASLLGDPTVPLTGEDEREIAHMMERGLYGSQADSIDTRLKETQKKHRFPRLHYLLFERAFPPLLTMSHRKIHPALAWLVYPYYWFRRFFRMLFSPRRRANMMETFRCLGAYRVDDDSEARAENVYFSLDGEGGNENA